MSYTSAYSRRHEKAALDTFKIVNNDAADLISVCKNGIKNGFDKNIFVSGGVGTGKTFVAYSLLNVLAERRESRGHCWYSSEKIKYCCVKDIIDDVKMGFTSDGRVDMTDYKKVPLLIIDEVGVQYGTDFERTELFAILDARYNAELPTIFISNFKRGRDLLKILGARIADRIFADCDYFELNYPSLRGKV